MCKQVYQALFLLSLLHTWEQGYGHKVALRNTVTMYSKNTIKLYRKLGYWKLYLPMSCTCPLNSQL